MIHQFEGIIIGAVAFLIIGLFHPIVVKGYYYFSMKLIPVFLMVGIACLIASFYVANTLLSACLGVLGFTNLWSIHELFEQKIRVEKGWFAANPKAGNDKKR